MFLSVMGAAFGMAIGHGLLNHWFGKRGFVPIWFRLIILGLSLLIVYLAVTDLIALGSPQ